MISIRAHLNNIALHHTVFDLPFAFIGALLAAGGRYAELYTTQFADAE